MASYGYSTAPAHYHTNVSSHNHHHHHSGRSRRGPRISSQNAQRQYKHLQQAQRSPKEVLVSGGVEQQQQPTFNDYLARLEAAMSFEFDDDEVFCPFHLLTEDDLQSIHSTSSSDRGSLSSGSPDSSPLQQQVQPTPSFLLSAASASNAYPTSAGYHQQQQHMKLHQPMARRNGAIPIVDPSTRIVASPPLSVSPGRQQQYVQRRGGW